MTCSTPFFGNGGTLDHWQTLAGGILAVGAAVLAAVVAYIVGAMQVGAARGAADAQVRAANQQLDFMRDAASRRDREVRKSLRNALNMDAARLKMDLETRPGTSADGGATPDQRYLIAQAYLLNMSINVKHSPDLDALLEADVCAAAREVAIRVDQYNAILLTAPVKGFTALSADLSQAQTKLAESCIALQRALGGAPPGAITA